MEVLLNLLIAVVVIIAICIVFFFIMRNADKKRLDSLEDEEVEIAEVNFHNAKVVKKYIIKKPAIFGIVTKDDYYMGFKTDYNEYFEFKVGEYIFTKFEVGKIGTLVVQNGEFVDFGDEEDFPEGSAV